MSCQSVQERISSLLDRMLADGERESVSAHLESCKACGAHYHTMLSMRAALRSLDKPPVPANVATALRVLASHERVRQQTRVSFSTRLRCWSERAELMFDNLMRPMALPFAGGLLSALVLFGVLVPNLSFQHDFSNDLQFGTASDPDGRLVESLPAEGSPTWLQWSGSSPEPWLQSASAVGSGDETVLELTIDETGRVADFAVSHGKLTPEMQSIILFSRFTPATFNGKNTWGKTQVFFHRRRNVRG